MVVVAGPTATGKTRLALALAQHFGGEIVSADSALVYRGLDIGTAKPTPIELLQVRHHLIDIVDIWEQFSLAHFQKLAQETIEALWRGGKVPFLVGGTGLYLRALLEGYTLPDAPPDERFRSRLKDVPLEEQVARLLEVDPEAAEIVDLKNPRRVVRALEVHFQTGSPFSSFYRRTDSGLDHLKLVLRWPRALLYDRIAKRVEQMLSLGLVEEVRSLFEKGYTSHLRRLRVIGYGEILDHLEGRCSLEDAKQLIVTRTTKFAKRQLTWFRKERGVEWLDIEDEGEFDDLRVRAEQLIVRFLGHSREKGNNKK